MSLNSLSFEVCFFALLIPLAALQPARKKFADAPKVQLALILAFSLFFVCSVDPWFCLCVLAVAAIAYVSGRVICDKRRKGALAAGIVLLLGMLLYFKYAQFFTDSFRKALGLDEITLGIILPVGISFYIFSAVSYLIDVYRGEIEAQTNAAYMALYISFFPKLVAGPIVRAKDFFSQAKSYRGVEWDAFKAGIQIFVFGLFKKIVLADRLGVFVDDVFRAPMAFNTLTVVLAAISYAMQIYFDFSGYSDMAIGISKILGFDFKPNFNLPYVAKDVSEFWKRWHISLSSWFADYLYIPLGGSRKGNMRTYLNLMIVMAVSGLWHGAGWTYVIWGVLHGAASCVNKAAGKYLKKAGAAVNIFITFVAVTLFWVVFRADSPRQAALFFKAMFTAHGGISQIYTWSIFAMLCLIAATAVAAYHSKKTGSTDKSGKPAVDGFYPLLDLSEFWQLTSFFTFCGLTVIMGYFGNTAFIYGAF